MTKWLVMLAALIVAADQAAKRLAVTHLSEWEVLPVINGFLGLTLVHNKGAAFGLFQNARWFFVGFTLVVLGSVVYYWRKMPQKAPYGVMRLALACIAGGAAGNMIDRARQGYVVDFFKFLFVEFPVFNVADMFVVCGTLLLAVVILFFVKDEPAEMVEN